MYLHWSLLIKKYNQMDILIFTLGTLNLRLTQPTLKNIFLFSIFKFEKY